MTTDYDAEHFTCPFHTEAAREICASSCPRAKCSGKAAPFSEGES